MNMSKLKISVTSAVALGVAGLTYVVLQKLKTKTAADALNYLTIEVIGSEKECEQAVAKIRRKCSEQGAIGFDCEWVTEQGRRQPIALLQLSTHDGYCALIRLNLIKSIPKTLQELLEDNSIYKVGVAPKDDARYLAQDYGIYMQGTLDIRHLVLLCGYQDGGLAAQSKSLLGIILDKTWRIRCSDWAAEVLSESQVKYAAADAHVAIKIFVKLINHYNKRGISLFGAYGRNNHWKDLNICKRYVDVPYRSKKNDKPSDKSNRTKDAKPVKETECKRYPHATRSKPLYHNCFLEAPDGELLCTCDNQKAMWYVVKELADVVSKEPLKVRLRFEPAGRSVGDVGRYYQLTKENKCVVCGAHDSYIRKNVVPREYRKYFPEIMKEHSSHDVVLLCVSCHQLSNMLDRTLRERLAEQCAAPLASHGHSRVTEDVDCKKIRSAARALLYQARKHVLPEARRAELEAVILQHYLQHDVITEELLKEAAEIQVVFENEDYESHGHKVMEHYMNNGGVLRLEELWREHFLSTMQPRYMPELWSVKHNEERLTVRLKEGRLSDEDKKLLGLSI
ncbi:exonuclease 3'-5' domain-containing protein 2 [Bicyclus anynana]|uniref:Exonuclease 3'-5' domain-containing protein 2 n=1 Tax=Bicyclus anynana TaxID=110368 RepID=A0A6J1PA92_BICAN|nr:exonuclease 3'-5' domain-containing protein 2 [Bicyclus anynana]